MSATVFIDGAVGTTGLEIRDRLAGRTDMTIALLPEERRKDPEARRQALNDADFVILCLPDDAAREAVALIDNPRTRVIDASSAHRVAPGWTYGFPELPGQAERIANAARVANPGCYPTGFLALIAPLITAGLTHAPIFAPAVANAYRGMVVEVPLHLHALPGRPSLAAIEDVLRAAFEGSTLVNIAAGDAGVVEIEENAGTDRLTLRVCGNDAVGHARLIATLDNLGKGAGGAAVQNLNIMAGVDPVAGLVF